LPAGSSGLTSAADGGSASASIDALLAPALAPFASGPGSFGADSETVSIEEAPVLSPSYAGSFVVVSDGISKHSFFMARHENLSCARRDAYNADNDRLVHATAAMGVPRYHMLS
jgi:hypothetical protein